MKIICQVYSTTPACMSVSMSSSVLMNCQTEIEPQSKSGIIKRLFDFKILVNQACQYHIAPCSETKKTKEAKSVKIVVKI